VPECPHCGQELACHDYFGKYTGRGASGIERRGQIFKCANERCEAFDGHFWALDSDGVLHEGYPC
jgi:hypothetical protein